MYEEESRNIYSRSGEVAPLPVGTLAAVGTLVATSTLLVATDCGAQMSLSPRAEESRRGKASGARGAGGEGGSSATPRLYQPP